MEEVIVSNFINIRDIGKIKKHSLIYKNTANYKYFVNKNGDLCRKRRNIIFNMYTLLTILLLVGGYLYSIDTAQCKLTLSHLDKTCDMYAQAKADEMRVQNERTCEKGLDGQCLLNTSKIINGVIINQTMNYSISDKLTDFSWITK